MDFVKEKKKENDCLQINCDEGGVERRISIVRVGYSDIGKKVYGGLLRDFDLNFAR